MGATPKMNRSAEGGQGRVCTMEAKAYSFTHRTKVFADGTVGKTRRDLRRTGRVSGWHRSKRAHKRMRKGERGSVSSRTAEQYLKRSERCVTEQSATRVGRGRQPTKMVRKRRKPDEQGRERLEQFLKGKTRTLSFEETGGLDQPDGCQEGPFLNRQSVQAEEPEDGLGKGEGEPGKRRCRWAEPGSFRISAGPAVGSAREGAEGRRLSTSAGVTTPHPEAGQTWRVSHARCADDL